MSHGDYFVCFINFYFVYFRRTVVWTKFEGEFFGNTFRKFCEFHIFEILPALEKSRNSALPEMLRMPCTDSAVQTVMPKTDYR